MRKFQVEFKNGTYEKVEASCELDALFKGILKKEGEYSKMSPVRVWDENNSPTEVKYSLLDKLLK